MLENNLTTLIAALQRGDYDTCLEGTKYEGAVLMWEPHPQLTEKQLEATDNLNLESKANAARVVVLEAALREMRIALEAVEAHHIKQNKLKGRDESRSYTLSTVRTALTATASLLEGRE